MSKIMEWLNPYYLRSATIAALREDMEAKPNIKYLVLDNFFIEEKLDQLIEYHKTLEFSEYCDKMHPDGTILPYDSSVAFARKGVGYGSELYFDEGWLAWLAHVCNLPYSNNTDIKQRYHKSEAGGFWIHTDSVLRNIAAICYFNKNWQAKDGGLLQLWQVDQADLSGTVEVNSPTGRMTCLENTKRIRTATPGGGFPDNKAHDLILVDQIVPHYNRLFLCNMTASPSFHSVSPSHGKPRLGFVQWVLS